MNKFNLYRLVTSDEEPTLEPTLGKCIVSRVFENANTDLEVIRKNASQGWSLDDQWLSRFAEYQGEQLQMKENSCVFVLGDEMAKGVCSADNGLVYSMINSLRALVNPPTIRVHLRMFDINKDGQTGRETYLKGRDATQDGTLEPHKLGIRNEAFFESPSEPLTVYLYTYAIWHPEYTLKHKLAVVCVYDGPAQKDFHELTRDLPQTDKPGKDFIDEDDTYASAQIDTQEFILNLCHPQLPPKGSIMREIDDIMKEDYDKGVLICYSNSKKTVETCELIAAMRDFSGHEPMGSAGSDPYERQPSYSIIDNSNFFHCSEHTSSRIYERSTTIPDLSYCFETSLHEAPEASASRGSSTNVANTAFHQDGGEALDEDTPLQVLFDFSADLRSSNSGAPEERSYIQDFSSEDSVCLNILDGLTDDDRSQLTPDTSLANTRSQVDLKPSTHSDPNESPNDPTQGHPSPETPSERKHYGGNLLGQLPDLGLGRGNVSRNGNDQDEYSDLEASSQDDMSRSGDIFGDLDDGSELEYSGKDSNIVEGNQHASNADNTSFWSAEDDQHFKEGEGSHQTGNLFNETEEHGLTANMPENVSDEHEKTAMNAFHSDNRHKTTANLSTTAPVVLTRSPVVVLWSFEPTDTVTQTAQACEAATNTTTTTPSSRSVPEPLEYQPPDIPDDGPFSSAEANYYELIKNKRRAANFY